MTEGAFCLSAGKSSVSAGLGLARRFLTLARNVTARGALKSSVSIGISPTVAEILSRLTLEQLERVAEVHTMALGPRWSDCPMIWQRLAEAAKSGDPCNLDLVDRWAAQLVAGEMLKNA